MSQDDTQDGIEEPEAQPWYPSTGPDREEMVNAYLPGESEWGAKTVLDLNDPHAVAALKEFEKMFPEVDDLQPLIDEFIEEFLRDRISIRGQSRDEFNRIYESMFGGHPDTETQRWASLVAGDIGDDD